MLALGLLAWGHTHQGVAQVVGDFEKAEVLHHLLDVIGITSQ